MMIMMMKTKRRTSEKKRERWAGGGWGVGVWVWTLKGSEGRSAKSEEETGRDERSTEDRAIFGSSPDVLDETERKKETLKAGVQSWKRVGKAGHETTPDGPSGNRRVLGDNVCLLPFPFPFPFPFFIINIKTHGCWNKENFIYFN